MGQDFLQVTYDPQNKIWKSINYPYQDQVKLSLGEQFLKTMRNINPNKILDHFYDTNTLKTAKEVYEQSILVAKNLQRLGVKKGDVVVLFCMNNSWTSVLTFGCILIGALVNFFEVHMEGEHIDYVFNILQPTAILYEDEYKTKILDALQRNNPKTCKLLISINGRTQPNLESELLKSDSKIDFDNFNSVEIKDPQHEIACLVLTSGSTGIPKVVQLTHTLMMHGMLIWFDNKTNYAPLNTDSVVFSFSPLRWVSQVGVMFQSMLLGLKRVSSCGVPTGDYGLKLLTQTGITHMFVVPSIFHDILLELSEHDTDSLKSLKLLQLGGEPPSKTAMDLTKKHALNCKVFQCYGMTEMASCITNDEHINGGKLLPGYEMQILDDDLKPLGPNQPGQLALKPKFPLKNYKGIDNEKYFNDQGLFINGDYGFIDGDNNLHILARYKDLVKSNNLILIPNTLEYDIINLSDVQVARLAGYYKSPQDSNQVAALFVVINPNSTCTQQELLLKILSTLKTKLSTEELAIVQDIYYVDKLPLTTCGKIDRVALSKLALQKSKN